MHSLRQKCRPKHQVLVLNCYPRTIKGTVDVKPNSSELSYLLYYATTRRSKVQKVGAFLEKKTSSDVWRARIGNVQVTLQIVAALIEKAPRDLPLYASYILKIFYIILQARDITTVESSLPTFMSFCQHHDGASLAADQEYLCQYEEIVDLYASFASTSPPSPDVSTNTPVALRWRNAGLQAIKCIFSSEALAAVADNKLDLIISTLLQNIWSDNNSYIDQLELKAQAVENLTRKSFSRRSMSVNTIHSMEISFDTKVALSGNSADYADKVAEADIGTLALHCLKLVFMVNNKSQIHSATVATLKFITEHIDQGKDLLSSDNRAIRIFKMISSWAPVQDRYTILITAMDILVHCPLEEGNLLEHLLLAIMMNSLLKSDINLIGLSVMDILLGLIQHMLRVLQLSYPLSQEANNSIESQWPLNSSVETPMDSPPSAEFLRKKLVERLQECIGNLANHIYYADQISDMVAAILWHLKPGQAPNLHNHVVQTENLPAAIPANHASNVSEDIGTDNGLFSFAIAKIRALEVIKSILVTAGSRKRLSGVSSLARNCVSSRVWEGTQWLLRESDGGVRKAYIAALLTWMKHEMIVPDIRTCEKNFTLTIRTAKDDSEIASSSKRSLSSTSQKDKNVAKMPIRSKFLELLHLAIYENALRDSESEEDILMLHLLLTNLVQHIGVNAVKNGLPMIFRLQEDVPGAPTPLARTLLGSLCHGYFWTLCENFKFHSTIVDHEIHNEIQRRQNNHCWVDRIRYPPLSLDHIRTPNRDASSNLVTFKHIGPDALRPFRNRSQMVELIFNHFEVTALQNASASISPTRSVSQSCLSPIRSSMILEFPEAAKEKMMSEWSRSSVIATVQEISRTVSLNGSKDGTAANKNRNTLATNESPCARSLSGNKNSLLVHKDDFRPSSNNGTVSGYGTLKKLRRSSTLSPSPLSSSSNFSVTRVDYLKRIISGQEIQTRWSRITGDTTPSDSSSESMVSCTYTTSEVSLNRSHSLELSVSDRLPRKCKRSRGRNDELPHASSFILNPNLRDDRISIKSHTDDHKFIPPIPCIPKSYKDDAVTRPDLTPLKDNKAQSLRKSSKPYHEVCAKEPLVTLEGFLNQIEVGPDGVGGDVTRPPY